VNTFHHILCLDPTASKLWISKKGHWEEVPCLSADYGARFVRHSW